MTRNYLYYFISSFLLLLAHIELHAQIPPPNDLCQNAIELSYNGPDCNIINVEIEGATNTAINSCFDDKEDVWYKIDVPSNTALIFKLITNTNLDSPAFSIFTGNCNNLTEYTCLGSIFGSSDTTGFILSDPSLIGQTIYLRIFDRYFSYNELELCTQTIDFLDFNATCQNSSEIIVNDFCDPNFTLIDTFEYIWSSDGFYENNCDIMYPSLWYHVTIPAQTRISVQVTSMSDNVGYLSYETYAGNCAHLDFLNCAYLLDFYNSGNIILENFDDAPVVQIIKIGSDNENETGVISLCAKILTPIENDICETATEIFFQTYPSCEPYPSIDFATVANEYFYSDYCYAQMLDVWYTFDDGDTIEAIVLDIESSFYDYTLIQYHLYNGSDCENFEFINCGDIFLNNYNSELLINIPDMTDSNWFIRFGIDSYSYYPSVDICFSNFSELENDDCLGASLIDINSACLDFINIAATPSIENFCDDDPDVWFKFQYDSEKVIQVITRSLNQYSSGNFSLSFFRGDCDNLELIECNIRTFSDLENQYTFRNPDLQGQMIYVALQSDIQSTQFNSHKYEMCVEDLTIDLWDYSYCSIAKDIHVNQAGLCDSSYLLGFTEESFYSAIGNLCHNEDVGYDGWLSFTVPANGKFSIKAEDLLILDPTDFSTISFYSGECAFPELISCVKLNDKVFEEYFFFESFANQKVYAQLVMENGLNAQFNICASESESAAIVNDNCLGALPLSLSGANCVNPNLATNMGAHRSEYGVDCPGFSNDVWFSIIVPETGNLIVETKTIAGSDLIDGVFALYSGTCDNLTLIACDDDSGIGNMPSYKIQDPSLANQELYLQFWSYNGAQEGDFKICLLELEEAVGDHCADAIFAVASNQESCYHSENSEVPFIANSFSGVAPDCVANISSDIWFQFSYKEGERLVFEFNQSTGSSVFDGQAALYRSTCDALTLVSCNDDSGPANMPSFDLEELIDPTWDGDQDFFVQFWDFNQGIGGNISYCLYDKDFVSLEVNNEDQVIIAPNPFSDVIRITLPEDVKGNVDWTIINAVGAKVKSGKFQIDQSNLDYRIDVQELIPSTYILRLKSENGQWVEKLLKS